MLKISACVIVKNEEANLPRWLAWAKALADEMVVVDTGSTDRTAELARKAGASVYSFEWRKDFSAAKNFALRKAKGDWIVFLDADEYFSEEDIPKVREHIQRLDKDRNVGGFICPLFNIDADRGGVILFTSVQLRVFRRHPDIRYHGAVHEMLRFVGKQWRTVQVEDVRVWHTGYSSGAMRRKLERDIEILEEERKRRGEIWSDACYLADCCYGLERYEEAMRWARKAVDSGKTLVGLEKRPYDVLIGAMVSLRRPPAEISEVVREALKKFPDTVEYKANEGVAFWQEKDFARAETVFEAALPMAAEGSGHIRAAVLGYLADIAYRRGDAAKAMDYAAEALKEERFYEPALSLLCRILSALPSADVIQFLNTVYDAAADADFLIRVLAKNGLHEVCLYYEKKAGRCMIAAGERLLFGGAYPAAAREAAHGMVRCGAMGVFAARRAGEEARAVFLPESLRLSEHREPTDLSREMQAQMERLERVFPAGIDQSEMN